MSKTKIERVMIGAQGEISIFRVSSVPEGLVPSKEGVSNGSGIVSHSESGHHHVLEGFTDIMEAPPEVVKRVTGKDSAGMRILYATLDSATALKQDGPVPHETHVLPPGNYEFRLAREFDPFTEKARRVAD